MKQVLVRESKFVRKHIIAYIEKLEEEIKKNRLPQTYKEALIELIKEIEKKEKLQQENTLLLEEKTANAPKVQFYNDVTNSGFTISMGEVAKLIDFKNVGRNNLFNILRDNKVLMENNVPYQLYIDKGWFRVIEVKYTTPLGDVNIQMKTVVYQKGVEGIVQLLNQLGYKKNKKEAQLKIFNF